MLYLILCAVTLFFNYADAQYSDIRFDHIGLEQGLSQSTIYAVTQDAYGFLWFATQDGLNRYDGYSIEVFKHKLNDSNSLADNAISCLLNDPPNNLWIGTINGGLDRYDITADKFYHHAHLPDNLNSISSGRVTVIYKDSKSNIWIGTQSGLNLFNKNANRFIRYLNGADKDNKTVYAITSLCEDKRNNLWIGTNKGLFRIGLNNISVIEPADNFGPDDKNSASSGISSVFVDRTGVLWIGYTENFVSSYNQETGEYTVYKNSVKEARPFVENSNGILWFGSLRNPGLYGLNLHTKEIFRVSNTQNDLVNAICEDNSGILWIGTYFHGIYKFDKRNNRFNHYLNNAEDPDVIMSILEDHEGGLWMGTFGNGLKYKKPGGDEIITFFNKPGNTTTISNNKVLSLLELPDNTIWIGTIGGGLDRYNKSTGKFSHYKQGTQLNQNSISSNNITSLYKDKNGGLWIGHYFGEIDIYNSAADKFTRLNPIEGPALLKGSTVTFFKEDKSGLLWIGTHGSGLLSYNKETNSLKKHDILPQKLENISTIHIDPDKIIWIGSDKYGLVRFDPASGASAVFTLDDLLSENPIYGILPDAEGNLWMSTNKGIIRFNTKSNEFKNYDKYDGLQSNEFNQGAFFLGEDGELFFGGVNGVNSFYPSAIKDNENIPPVYLTTFKVFDRILPIEGSFCAAKKIELSYSQNFFSFEFAALSYTTPEKNKYAYMLEGLDKDWHYVPASQRYAGYTNIDPGEYLLRIKASNNDGIWNEKGASIIIVITPPFWMTWWFRIIAAGVIAALIIFIYKYRIRQLLKVERMRFQIATDLHDDIGTSLTGIALYSDLAKQEAGKNVSKTVYLLDRIANSSRSLLDQMNDIVWFIKPDNDSLESAVLRMSDTAINMFEAKGIEHQTNISGDLKDVNLTMDQRRNLLLIFKEMVNNVLKHSNAAEVKIDILVENGRKGKGGIIISIKDNGCGFDPEKVSRGNGIRNMRKRAESIGADIFIEALQNKGTHIKLTAPFKIT